MSDLEVLEKSFMESMDSMTKAFKEEKESLEKKIIELKEKNIKLRKEKENDKEMFKLNIQSNSEELARLQNINKDLTMQLENSKLKEKQLKKYEEDLKITNELKSQINKLNLKVKELESDKKELQK